MSPSCLQSAAVTFLLLTHGLVLVRATFVLHRDPATTAVDKALLLRTGYCNCANENFWMRKKDQQRPHHSELVYKVHKKICEMFYGYVKMRLRVKKFSTDSPCSN